MALARSSGARRPDTYTWPGFVDALATLLMVIIFVLLVFVLIQVNLAYRVAGQDATMNDMRAQILDLGELLNIERKATADLTAELASITTQLATATEERHAGSTAAAKPRRARPDCRPACRGHHDAWRPRDGNPASAGSAGRK